MEHHDGPGTGEQVYKLDAAAEMLGIPLQELRARIAAGKVRVACLPGHDPRITMAEIERLLDEIDEGVTGEVVTEAPGAGEQEADAGPATDGAAAARAAPPGLAVRQFAFDGQQIVTVVLPDGRPCFLVPNVEQVLGYEQSALAHTMRHWADEMIRGVDFEVIEGEPLKSLKAALGSILLLSLHTRAITVLFESGLNLVCIKTEKPAGKRLRRKLADEVLPEIRRTGSYVAPGAVPPGLSEARVQEIVERVVENQLVARLEPVTRAMTEIYTMQAEQDARRAARDAETSARMLDLARSQAETGARLLEMSRSQVGTQAQLATLISTVQQLITPRKPFVQAGEPEAVLPGMPPRDATSLKNEKTDLSRTLDLHRWNIEATARELHVTGWCLRRTMKRLGLEPCHGGHRTRPRGVPAPGVPVFRRVTGTVAMCEGAARLGGEIIRLERGMKVEDLQTVQEGSWLVRHEGRQGWVPGDCLAAETTYQNQERRRRVERQQAKMPGSPTFPVAPA
jgi:prophage antirepressor-like protein